MASMFFIVTFLSLGAVFGSPLSSSEEDKSREDGLNVINGDYSTINKHPINVAYLISNNIWGAGVIVNDSWILTTAFNCLWVDPSYITVRVGSSYWTQDGVLIQAEKCIMHPNYNGTWANNIALVKLVSPITFGKTSKRGRYQPKTSLKIPGATYNVSGWGVRSASYKKETQLQSVSQTVLDDSECGKYYNLTDATGSFCASNPEGGPCVFDFGAPLSKNKIVVGLYQGSTDCTQPQAYPDLYVDVFQYADWITSVIASQ